MWIGTQEAGIILSITDRRVRAMIKAGILPAKRDGKRLLLDSEAVLAAARVDRPPGRPKRRKDNSYGKSQYTKGCEEILG